MIDTESAPVAFQRHIIERPRLMRLLEGAKERVILLTAPAGYGKTTLARQWSVRRPSVVWCACTSASSDPAALALTIAREIEGFAPDDARRIRTFLRATQAEINVPALTDRIVAGMRAWPEGTWLFVDDYHLIPERSGGAALVQAIAEASVVRIMVASRLRPEWTRRDLLYGEVLELDGSVLAMDKDEVGEVLAHRKLQEITWFTASAGGWPAIVGLASLTTAGLPDKWAGEVHDYFAREVFGLLSPEAQEGILRLALAPVVTPATVDELVGGDAAEITREAIDQGFLTPVGPNTYVVHPLLLSFLRSQPAYPGDHGVEIDRLLNRLLRENALDDAFGLIQLHSSPARMQLLLRDGIEELLHSGRTQTLEEWVSAARRTHLADPVVELAASHVAFRAGEHLRALRLARLAENLVSDADPFAARIALHAGLAAYFADDIRLARLFFSSARAAANEEADFREILWQEFSLACYMGDTEATALLADYEQHEDGSPTHHVRLAIGRLSLASSFGGLSEALAATGDAAEIVHECEDPMVAASLFTALARAYTMNGQYGRAADAVKEATTIAEKYELTFAKIQMSVVRCGIEIGLRRYAHAAALLDRLERASQNLNDAWLEVNALSLRARLYAVHAPDRDLTEPCIAGESNSIRDGVYRASLSLLEAARGDWAEARRLAAESQEISEVIEVRILATLVNAAADVATEATNAATTLQAALDEAHRTGNFNALVVTYRAYPVFLAHCGGGEAPQWLRDVLAGAGDSDIARIGGIPLPPTGDRRKLSRRELQVLKLVGEGLTNPEIGNRLFISPGTVKVHLQHAYEKLGVRTRTEAALRAAAEDELGDF